MTNEPMAPCAPSGLPSGRLEADPLTLEQLRDAPGQPAWLRGAAAAALAGDPVVVAAQVRSLAATLKVHAQQVLAQRDVTARLSEERTVHLVDAAGQKLAPTTRSRANALLATGKAEEILAPGGGTMLRLRRNVVDPQPPPPKEGRAAKRRRAAIRALRTRDGDDCFYCLRPMAPEEMTIEHLLAIKREGSDVRANQALAHKRCNERAGHLSVVEKVRLREAALRTKLAGA